ncbi:hypothetical protein C8Q80DRAFT_1222709 [Daedaleopsis nitida]|nr:hypothetical protein C8Q80DRAFT_1222709 [Daedaleopsis nitida]
MAAAAPSHRIHTIHGAFGAPSRYTHSSLSMSPAQASWNRIPNVCAPRRPHDSPSRPISVRTTPASLSASASASGIRTSAAGSRPRRTTMSYGSPTPLRRAPLPPSAPAERTAPALATPTPPALELPPLQTIAIPEAENPFADAQLDDLSPFPPTTSTLKPRTSLSSYTMSPSSSSESESASAYTTIAVPPGLVPAIPSAKDMRGRLVASVLLSRGSGRPLGVYLRRRFAGVGQTYVKSGLSQLVAAAA